MRAVLVPGVLALLPEYAGLTDPVADLRAACLEAVAWLGEERPVEILADAQGERVARALLSGAGVSTRSAPGGLAAQPPVPGRVDQPAAPGGLAAQPPMLGRGGQPSVLVVGNGSACRSEKAPGHLDERAACFDDALRAALVAGDVSAVDWDLGAKLMASLDGIARLSEILTPGCEVIMDYDGDPFGVQYWVMRWES